MSEPKQASEVRLGIIGTGWWAVKNHIPVLQSRQDVKITSICEIGHERLTKIMERFGIPFGTEDYRELIKQGLDGVVVSSPHGFHFDHALAALELGLHVLCEKPMALKAVQARQLASIAASNHLHFLIPYGWNYTGFAAAANNLVASGRIGTIEYVNCLMGSSLRDLFSGEDPWFSRQDLVKPDPKTWSDPSRGGGFAHGQLTHALGLLFYITGLRPDEVFAQMTFSPTGADLTNALSCKFKDGAMGSIGGAGTMPALSTYQVDIRVFGTEGMLLLDIERPRLELRRHDGDNLVLPVREEPGQYICAEPLHTFVDLIQQKNVQNRSSAQLGVSVVEVLDAAFESTRSGKSQAIANLR